MKSGKRAITVLSVLVGLFFIVLSGRIAFGDSYPTGKPWANQPHYKFLYNQYLKYANGNTQTDTLRAENFRKQMTEFATKFMQSHQHDQTVLDAYNGNNQNQGQIVTNTAGNPPTGTRQTPATKMRKRAQQAAGRWKALEDRTAALTDLFNNLKDELDNKKDELRDEMMAILKENQIDGTKLEGSELEHYNKLEKQLGEIAGKEDFLDEIENLSPGELIKKRDELAVEADTSGKYTLLLDYMEAEDKNKFLADKRIELNNQKTELMMQLAQATGENIEELRDLENFITEIEYLDAGQLADKKDELFKQILNNPSDETAQWKLDMLGQVFGVYDKFSESAGNPFAFGGRHNMPVYHGNDRPWGGNRNRSKPTSEPTVDSPWFPEYSDKGGHGGVMTGSNPYSYFPFYTNPISFGSY